MVTRFGTARQKPAENTANPLPHQDRVNIEVFKAIELLGRKLERVEDERDRLARRLALIESSAAVDEKTGKLYLPVSIDPSQLPYPATPASAPRWMAVSSLMSSAVALCALGVVLFHDPQPLLTREQMAAINALTAPQFEQMASKAWKHPDETAEVDETPPALPPQQQPAAVQPAPAVSAITPPQETKNTDTASATPPVATPAPDTKVAAIVPPAPPAAPSAPVAEPENITAEDKVLPPAVTASATAPVKITPDAQPPKTDEPAKTAERAKPAEPKIASAAPVKQEKAPVKTSSADDLGPDAALPAKLAQVERRALDGVPEAQHDLGTLYASGKAVKQDYKRAVYWFSKAADGGVANADYNLGVMFQQGLGVKQDVPKALDWYKKAADMGHPEAMYNLGIAYIEGVGAPKDVNKAVTYFQNAANAGVAQAAFNLGVLYESNFIGKIDIAKALEWYQVAANEGHADAQAAVSRLKTQTGKDVANGAAAGNDQSLKMADLVEPASGETGEGDASPADENAPAKVAPQKDLIAKIQSLLVRQGLLPQGSVSGALDSRTEDAIRAWQSKSSVTVDGLPSQALLDKMTAAQKN